MNAKKAQGLESLALMIIAMLVIVFGIMIFFNSNLISSTTGFFCPSMTTFGTNIRGPYIKMMDEIYDRMAAVEDPEIWEVVLIGKNLGTAVSQTVIRTVVKGMFDEAKETMPLMSCTAPNIDLGYSKQCSPTEGVSNITFFREVAARTVDCYRMYGSGNYNPLENTNLRNPRTCFVIQFNLKEPVKFYDIKDYMTNNVKGAKPEVLLEGYERDNYADFKVVPWEQQIKKGILFISYADTGGSEWDNDDCSISGSISWDDRDSVFWCIEEEATYDENCKLFGWSNG